MTTLLQGIGIEELINATCPCTQGQHAILNVSVEGPLTPGTWEYDEYIPAALKWKPTSCTESQLNIYWIAGPGVLYTLSLILENLDSQPYYKVGNWSIEDTPKQAGFSVTGKVIGIAILLALLYYFVIRRKRAPEIPQYNPGEYHGYM